jgi:FkbM family methyltransferase
MMDDSPDFPGRAVLEEFLNKDDYRINDMDPVDLVVDLGLNVGFFSLMILERFPDCRIVGYEASPLNLEQAWKHFETFGFHHDQVEIHPEAVWQDSDGVTFQPTQAGCSHVAERANPDGMDTEGLLKTHPEADEFIAVPSVTLDEVLSEFDRVPLMKVDIEGAEMFALRAASRETMLKVDRLVMEYHHFWGEKERKSLFSKLRETHSVEFVEDEQKTGSGMIHAETCSSSIARNASRLIRPRK